MTNFRRFTFFLLSFFVFFIVFARCISPCFDGLCIVFCYASGKSFQNVHVRRSNYLIKMTNIESKYFFLFCLVRVVFIAFRIFKWWLWIFQTKKYKNDSSGRKEIIEIPKLNIIYTFYYDWGGKAVPPPQF